MKVYDVFIIGGGPAGYTAALYAARAGLSTILAERGVAGGQMTTTEIIENYPGFPDGIDGFLLGENIKSAAEKFGAESVFATVTAAELRGEVKLISTEDGEFSAKTVIIAAGATPKKLGVPGEEQLRGRGVSYCATCDGMLFRGKDVVVIGGGNTAAADALYLSRLCRSVTVIHRRDRLRASNAYLAPLNNAENIKVMYNATVSEILGDSAVRAVTVNGSELLCDGVFIAVGYSPETALFASQLELTDTGAIKAGEDTKTSLPGVFAAGDIRQKPLKQIVTAASDGAVAAAMAEEFLSI